jgi:Tol biopolymer transport system component
MPRRSAFSFLLESTWAPDGQHLAVSDGWDLVHSTIRVVSLGQGRLLRPLARPSHRRADFSPAWSPGGRTIAFVRQRVRRGAVTGPPVILLVAPDGTSLRRLTRGAAPSWSPNGRHLVYARGSGIYRIEADGDARTRIAGGLNGYGGYLQPQWSPDGRKILYVTKDGIWAMNVDGSDHVRVVRLSYPGGAGWRPG